MTKPSSGRVFEHRQVSLALEFPLSWTMLLHWERQLRSPLVILVTLRGYKCVVLDKPSPTLFWTQIDVTWLLPQ